jgi:hypothetical protein
MLVAFMSPSLYSYRASCSIALILNNDHVVIQQISTTLRLINGVTRWVDNISEINVALRELHSLSFAHGSVHLTYDSVYHTQAARLYITQRAAPCSNNAPLYLALFIVIIIVIVIIAIIMLIIVIATIIVAPSSSSPSSSSPSSSPSSPSPSSSSPPPQPSSSPPAPSPFD